MTWWPYVVLALSAFGVVHCSAATRRELASGIAKGRLGDYRRGANPLGFWTIIVMNMLAVIAAALFFCWAAATILLGLK